MFISPIAGIVLNMLIGLKLLTMSFRTERAMLIVGMQAVMTLIIVSLETSLLELQVGLGGSGSHEAQRGALDRPQPPPLCYPRFRASTAAGTAPSLHIFVSETVD
ncbi:hypothetical protein PGT21_032374 [Puccinia graminis f. sp. tritici]|uniref:Uncharacterized protein n=2 Tax=Puccinia graminis f. sp. tritici TaxID=56615 RepID=H6QR52_PUCGT|nr:uncharacterized protein PGTG_21319 [Puccinia graminis f. sp. tritici CRL 75-36-700-3]EHS63027.1 hypothetical protein PGTG_21319 [Puccinia graminis f. sp. tritici CRL 75-36-700-3]KAA1109057.1 hypothetical protein PGT21_032374 [Puccinia graminis f. sp. tritici]KAA1133147.1 hypothetical protein PGTUg99_021413 [Puccinia graminis f. sp. tritici]